MAFFTKKKAAWGFILVVPLLIVLFAMLKTSGTLSLLPLLISSKAGQQQAEQQLRDELRQQLNNEKNSQTKEHIRDKKPVSKRWGR